jgi:hypothetical protein
VETRAKRQRLDNEIDPIKEEVIQKAKETRTRNKQANALSCTIFPFQAGADQLLQYLGSFDSSGSDRKWIWKDGKGGYNELLKLRNNPIVTNSNYASVSPPSSQQTLDSEAFMWSHLEYIAYNTLNTNAKSLHIHLLDDIWYQDIYNYLTTAMCPDGYNRIQKRALQHKAKQYRLIGGDLFFVLRGVQKRYIQKHKIAELLYNTLNKGGYFSGQKTQLFLKDQGILWILSPVGAKKATGMAEKSNDLLQRILKKIRVGKDKWPPDVQNATFELNRREIIHLGHTPYEILFGYQPSSKTELAFPTVNRARLALMLTIEE